MLCYAPRASKMFALQFHVGNSPEFVEVSDNDRPQWWILNSICPNKMISPIFKFLVSKWPGTRDHIVWTLLFQGSSVFQVKPREWPWMRKKCVTVGGKIIERDSNISDVLSEVYISITGGYWSFSTRFLVKCFI